MLGCVDLIAREAKLHPDTRLADMADNLAIINHCGTVLSVLTENLLSQNSSIGSRRFSLQASSGKSKLELESSRRENVRVLCESVLAVLKALAYQKNLQIDLQVDKKVPKNAAFPKSLFCQVLINLGANAVKYNNAGTVTIKVSMEGEGIRVAVIDSGPGVSSKFEQSLFQEYARDANTAFSQAGAGLGLSIAKRLVESMGGRIGYSRNPTTFWFELPFDRESGKEFGVEMDVEDKLLIPKTDNKTEFELGNDALPSILMVEDNALNVKVLLAMLKTVAPLCQVMVAVDGAAALEILLKRVRNREKPLLVLMDRNMPLVNGEETKRGSGWSCFLTLL